MKFPSLEQTLKDLESEIDLINILHKDWWLASDGAICGACEFVVPALAKRTNAFIDAFAKMVRLEPCPPLAPIVPGQQLTEPCYPDIRF